MSTTEAEVLQAITRGMRCALTDATTFTEDFTAAINTEYLVTVNIAQRLAEHCPLVGTGDLRVELEKKTKEFATEALPFMTPGGNFRTRSVFRKGANATRNGRVDIAILKGGPGFDCRSWCAIEVKGFNPQARVVKLDLCRNVEFFLIEGPTGTSSVELTVFCAFQNCKDTVVEADKDAAHGKVRSRYQAIIDELRLDPRLTSEIVVFDASCVTATGNETQEEFAYLDDIHHFVGVLVIFRRR